MRVRGILGLLAALLMPGAASAQTELARRLIWADGGGLLAFAEAPAGAGYEHALGQKRYLRVGLAAVPREYTIEGSAGTVATRTRWVVPVPVTVAFLHGGGPHFLELGAGVMLILDREEHEFGPAATIHYRAQGRGSGAAFRAGLSFFLEGDGWTVYPWPGVSLGYAF